MFTILIVILVIVTQEVLSQKNVGDSCTDEYTNTLGVCIPSVHCTSARIALESNGVRPTFCLHSFDMVLVCCRDTGTYVPSSTTVAPTSKEPASAQPGPLLYNIGDVTTNVPTTTTTATVPVDSDTSMKPSLSPPPIALDSSNNEPVSMDDKDSGINRKRISERKCEEYSSYAPPLMPAPGSVPNELIVGGVTTSLNEFPHMAAIGWLNFDDAYSFNCGGSLISPKFVLTAGHCTSDPTARVRAPSVVRLGDQNIDPNQNDGAYPEEIPIKKIIKHHSYAPPLKYNDIALLELTYSAQLNAAVHPACLWTKEEVPYKMAIATGWGVTDAHTSQRSSELQKVSLTLQDTAYCDRLLFVNRNRNWFGFAPTQLCAGELSPGKDTCKGDSGAPLQVKVQNYYRIVGITSFGLNDCAKSGRPAIYTRVSSYVLWIESIVWPGE